MNLHRKRLILLVVTTWLVLFAFVQNQLQFLVDYGYFFIVGLTGAIVANSTGAGGGIIFIPFFSALGITNIEALGTSILIQCFGMTAGAISWLTMSRIVKTNSHHLNQLISQILFISGLSSIVGVLCGQYLLVPEDPAFMALLFKIFSIIFGFILLVIIFNSHKQIHTQFDLVKSDIALLIFTCFIGGLITAWISVGIGEIIAIVLILRRYPTMVAISMGVAMSSITVLTAASYHILITNSVNWPVIFFAVPGAILGGMFAYLLSEKLGPLKLKIFFSLWIIITGLLM